jgi:hypothetical protein
LIPAIRVRVVWGLGETIETFWPRRRFISVDFPTFGRPTIATKPDLKWLACNLQNPPMVNAPIIGK